MLYKPERAAIARLLASETSILCQGFLRSTANSSLNVFFKKTLLFYPKVNEDNVSTAGKNMTQLKTISERQRAKLEIKAIYLNDY